MSFYNTLPSLPEVDKSEADLAFLKGKFMLTYDDTAEIRQLADKFNLQFRTIPMKTTHHLEKNEIILSDNFSWWPEYKVNIVNP